MNPTLNCSKCGGAMEEGFLLEFTHGSLIQSRWLEGKPERAHWTGLKTRGRQELTVMTYRCETCGFLESYAGDKGEAPA